MIAHLKPIAHPNRDNSQLAYADGFSTGDSNSAFNPASFTRHFLGSPISGSPTAQLLSSLDVSEMDDSLLNDVNIFEKRSAVTTPVAISDSTTSTLFSNISKKLASSSSILPPLNLKLSHKSPSIQSYIGSYNAIILACAKSGTKSFVNKALRLARQMLDSHQRAKRMEELGRAIGRVREKARRGYERGGRYGEQ